MLARLQKCITITLVAAALAWGVWFFKQGHSVLAACGALVILLGYAVFLAGEFATLHFVQTGDVAPRPSIRMLISAWAGEVISTPRIFLWRQPFRSNVECDQLPQRPDGQPGLLLVHGFFCNRGFWNPWMRELRRRRVPYMAINLEPIFGSIDRYVQGIEAAVATLEAATGAPVVLVGHSMGGLAIRAWFAKLGSDRRVRRIITIGSPHQGTWLARFGRTTNGRQMRLESPWLTELARGESGSQASRFTCFFGNCDNIVFPAGSGMLPGALNIHVPATAHVHMAFRPQVFDEVCRWLR